MSPSPLSQIHLVELSHHLILPGRIMAVKLHLLCNMMMMMMMAAATMMTVLKVVQGPHLAQPQTLAVLLLNQV